MALSGVSKNFKYHFALYLPAISIMIAILYDIYQPITRRTIKYLTVPIIFEKIDYLLYMFIHMHFGISFYNFVFLENKS